MSDTKRPQQGGERPKKKRFRSVRKSTSLSNVHVSCHLQDGTPIWGKRSIDGPGIWVSCVKGKEKQTVGELYDLFESVGRAASHRRGYHSSPSPSSLPPSSGQRPMPPVMKTAVTIQMTAQCWRIWRNNFRRNLRLLSGHVKSRHSVSVTPLLPLVLINLSSAADHTANCLTNTPCGAPCMAPPQRMIVFL